MKGLYMNTVSIVLERMSVRSQVLATVLAIGLGVSLPRVFHFFGLGHVFLPMFAPIVIVAPMLSIPFLLATAMATPFLSTLLFGMPLWTVTPVMAVQLTIVGTMQWLLRQIKLPVWTIAPLSIITERIITLTVSVVISSIGISSSGILSSYPGIIMLSIIGIIISKFYDR